MSDLLLRWGTWLYDHCVTFVIHVATVLDITYRDANALLFFVLWPAVTVALLAWIGWNAVALLRERSRGGDSAQIADPDVPGVL